jgi:hypothetical protein
MFQVWPDGSLGQVSLNCPRSFPCSIDANVPENVQIMSYSRSIFLFCNVPLTPSYLALLDATALLATVL